MITYGGKLHIESSAISPAALLQETANRIGEGSGLTADR
jgi:hypothetical protein